MYQSTLDRISSCFVLCRGLVVVRSFYRLATGLPFCIFSYSPFWTLMKFKIQNAYEADHT